MPPPKTKGEAARRMLQNHAPDFMTKNKQQGDGGKMPPLPLARWIILGALFAFALWAELAAA